MALIRPRQRPWALEWLAGHTASLDRLLRRLVAAGLIRAMTDLLLPSHFYIHRDHKGMAAADVMSTLGLSEVGSGATTGKFESFESEV